MIKEPSPKGSMAGKQSPGTIFHLESLLHTCQNGGSVPRAPSAMASPPSHLCKVSTKWSIQKFQGMASSKKRANFISSIASLIYFILIIFQIPLFRVPCRTGICTTPIELTSSQLIASEIFPAVVVKTLLYPGAYANAIIKNTSIPSYNNLLDVYNSINVKEAPVTTDLQYLEVLAGSYFSVAGAFLGLLKYGRVSLFGMLIIIWGLVKEAILRKPPNTSPLKSVYMYPAMSIAVVSAFSSIRRDVRRLMRSCRARHVAKHPWSSSKSKRK